MRTIGHLTAGVAHNFNNLLSAITPALDILADEVSGANLEMLNDTR
ncbi:MAG: hypothetical protein ACI9MC_001777 [Kiritimatiellia bacterium]|jgi:hypothetical protein